MATTNYNLPIIDNTMTGDIPRDMNALANATDTALLNVKNGSVQSTSKGAANGVAPLDASSILPAVNSTALTGDITKAAGSGITAITAGVIVNADINVAAAIDPVKLANGTVNATEFQFLDGVTSAIQTQLNAKQAALGFTPLNKAGDTATNLLLAADPTVPFGAVTKQFAEINFPKKSIADTTYYVLKTGSDSNTGLAPTAGGAFLTIAKAISMIPQVVNHVYVINVGAGTYAESPSINGYCGSGSIQITGDSVVSTSRSAVSFSMSNNSLLISIDGFNMTNASGVSFNVASCANVKLSKHNLVSVGNALQVESSKVYLLGCTVSNKALAIYSHVNGEIVSDTNGGTGNTTALYAQYGGVIKINGAQPTGAQGVAAGGSIIPITGVVNPWGDNNSAVSKAANGYQKLPSGLIIQWGLVTIPTNTVTSITLPTAFPNLNASVVATIEDVTTPFAVSTAGANLTLFNALHAAGVSKVVKWVAIGY